MSKFSGMAYSPIPHDKRTVAFNTLRCDTAIRETESLFHQCRNYKVKVDGIQFCQQHALMHHALYELNGTAPMYRFGLQAASAPEFEVKTVSAFGPMPENERWVNAYREERRKAIFDEYGVTVDEAKRRMGILPYSWPRRLWNAAASWLRR
jgi:hypothetical protein